MQKSSESAYANSAYEAPTPEQQQQQQQQQQQLPPSLEYLAQVDQLLVKQKKEMVEMLVDWECANKYAVLNAMGQQIFFAKEKSSTWQRQCCGASREFEMRVYDNNEQEVIHIHRPLKCLCLDQSCSCMECCLDLVTVEAPPGRVAGSVKQISSDCRAKFEIRDASERVVLQIHGPHYCRCHCPGDDIPFTVLTADGSQEVGKVSRQWANLLQEFFTDADNFGISFPADLHTDIKATILGACFLIDFMFFENNND